MKDFDITLYGILDPEHCRGHDLDELARIAAQNGVTILQYRDKISSFEEMIVKAQKIKSALETSVIKTRAPKLLINDHVQIAQAVGADGVHLGQQDMKADMAREILGEQAIIGLSIKSEADIENSPLEAIDYAFIGGVHPTTSKDNKRAIGVAGWQKLAAILRHHKPDMPVGAIAGFNAQNVQQIFRAGADGVAMISALFGAKSAEQVAQICNEMRRLIDEIQLMRGAQT